MTHRLQDLAYAVTHKMSHPSYFGGKLNNLITQAFKPGEIHCMTCHSWIHGTCVNYNGGSVKSKGGQKQMDTSKE